MSGQLEHIGRGMVQPEPRAYWHELARLVVKPERGPYAAYDERQPATAEETAQFIRTLYDSLRALRMTDASHRVRDAGGALVLEVWATP